MANFTYWNSQSFRTLTHWQSGGGGMKSVTPWFNLAYMNGKSYTLPMNFTTGIETVNYVITTIPHQMDQYSDCYTVKGQFAFSTLEPVKVIKTEKGSNDFGYIRGVLKFGEPEAWHPYSVRASGLGDIRVTNVTSENWTDDTRLGIREGDPFPGDVAYNVILPKMQKYVIIFTKFENDADIPEWLVDKITDTDNTYKPAEDIPHCYSEDQRRFTEAARVVPYSTFYHKVKVPKSATISSGRVTSNYGGMYYENGESYAGGFNYDGAGTYFSAGMRNVPLYKTWFGKQEGRAGNCLGFTTGQPRTDVGTSVSTTKTWYECAPFYFNMGYASYNGDIIIRPYTNYPVENANNYFTHGNTIATLIYEITGWEFKENVLQITR